MNSQGRIITKNKKYIYIYTRIINHGNINIGADDTYNAKRKSENKEA